MPVAAVSVAAPAFAVSGPAPTALITSICTCGGDAQGRTYRIAVTFTNTITTSFTLSNLSVSSGNLPSLPVTASSTTVAAGPGTTDLTFTFTRTNGSTVSPVSLTYTATNTSNNTASAPQTTPSFIVVTAPTCASPTC